MYLSVRHFTKITTLTAINTIEKTRSLVFTSDLVFSMFLVNYTIVVDVYYIRLPVARLTLITISKIYKMPVLHSALNNHNTYFYIRYNNHISLKKGDY